MSQITIDLTEQQEYFLKNFAAKQYPESKDNVCTVKPIHLVQTRRERVVDPDYDSPDITVYYVPDDCESYDSAQALIEAYYEDEECPIPIVSFDEAYESDRFVDIHGEEQVIVHEDDYLEAYGIQKDHYHIVHSEYYYDTVAIFWTLDEAKLYMVYQKHNLCHPRTYTISGGYANKGEYEHFWDLLYDLGCQLNQRDQNELSAEMAVEGGDIDGTRRL